MESQKPQNPNVHPQHPNLRAGEARAVTNHAKEDLVDQGTEALIVMMMMMMILMMLVMLMVLMVLMITNQYLQH